VTGGLAYDLSGCRWLIVIDVIIGRPWGVHRVDKRVCAGFRIPAGVSRRSQTEWSKPRAIAYPPADPLREHPRRNFRS